jgi:hypothetical protein
VEEPREYLGFFARLLDLPLPRLERLLQELQSGGEIFQ